MVYLFKSQTFWTIMNNSIHKNFWNFCCDKGFCETTGLILRGSFRRVSTLFLVFTVLNWWLAIGESAAFVGLFDVFSSARVPVWFLFWRLLRYLSYLHQTSIPALRPALRCKAPPLSLLVSKNVLGWFSYLSLFFFFFVKFWFAALSCDLSESTFC